MACMPMATRTVREIAAANKKTLVSAAMGCGNSYASEVAAGKKPIGGTRTLARFAKHFKLTGRELLASLQEWYPEVFTDPDRPAAR